MSPVQPTPIFPPSTQTEKPKDQAKTRLERRFQERAKEDLFRVHDKLLLHFFNFFITHEEPEGEEVAEKLDQLNAQWITFCKARKFKPFTYDMLTGAADEIVKKYKAEKKLQPPPPPPPPSFNQVAES